MPDEKNKSLACGFFSEKHLLKLQELDKLIGRLMDSGDPDAQRLAHEQLKRAVGELIDAHRAKDRFFGMLAHELRAPLTPLLNSLDSIHTRGFLDKSQERLFEIVERQGRQLGALLDDLGELARLGEGQIELQREHTDLVQAARQAVEALGATLEDQRLELRAEWPGEPLWLSADPRRLQQLLVFLLRTAAAGTPPGGELRLKCERRAGELVLTLRDNGQGIAPERLANYFDPLSQAEEPGRSAVDELDLGPAIAKGLVELHGGQIEVMSEGLGKGSMFEIRLPLSGEPAATPQGRPAAAVRPGQPTPVKVLVVEDNVDAAASMAELLEEWGHKPLVAHDGLEAVREAFSFQPEVVLLDIGLPNMDGYQVAQLLREMPDQSSALIVAITGYGQPRDKERAYEVGIDLHLTKPVNMNFLKELLSAYNGRPNVPPPPGS